MNPTFRITACFCLSLASLWFGVAPGARADAVSDFYHGKEMKMVIRSPAGSGYDAYGRLLARHMIDHIPGHPSVMLPINMPGGGGIRAANYVANVAPKDGTVVTIVSLGLPMYQALALGNKLQADMSAFNWLGSLNNSNSVLVTWHGSPTKTLEDAKKRETLIGATGAGSASEQLPAIYNNVLGTKFKIVIGYRSLTDIQLAMERGEVEGIGTAPWDSYVVTKPEWVNDGKLNVIVQVGLKKDKNLPQAPLLRDLGDTPHKKAMLEFVSKSFAIGWPFAVAPGVRQDRVKALRTAFGDTMRDPGFLADAKKQRITIEPIDGGELQQLIQDVISAPQDVRNDVKTAIEPKATDTKKVKNKAK